MEQEEEDDDDDDEDYDYYDRVNAMQPHKKGSVKRKPTLRSGDARRLAANRRVVWRPIGGAFRHHCHLLLLQS